MQFNFGGARRLPLMLACSALAFPTLAAAQDAATQPPAADAAGSDDGSIAGEIIVTATKAGEALDKAPITAISVDSTQIERLNIQSVRDAQAVLPSVVYKSRSARRCLSGQRLHRIDECHCRATLRHQAR
ncbi:MAG: hypothetical protein P8Y58_17420 [Novosphingobium sp.]